MARLSSILLFFSATLYGAACLAAGAPSAIFALSGKEAAAAVASALQAQGEGDAIRVAIEGVRDDDAIATASSPVTASVDALQIDKPHSRWRATLLLAAGDKNLAPVNLLGRYDEMVALPVLKRRMGAGEIIAEDDIDTQPEPAARVRKNTLTEARLLIGKTPRHSISQERPIRLDEVMNPPIIGRGARVTLLYKSPSLEIKTLGEAMESGAKGDVIRVRNVTSKVIVQGTVEGPDRVRVAGPDSVSAEAAP